jgi:AbrB family looped-hinge helix DNA binding protein
MKDKYIGICRVSEKGQIVIPKPVRDMFDIKSGDSLAVLCDKKKGIAIVKADIIDAILSGEDK